MAPPKGRTDDRAEGRVIPPQSLANIAARMRRYGPSNCWTGTTGTLAADVNRLLAERTRLLAQIDELKVEIGRLHEKQRWVNESP
jgi:hypothetical protein